MMLSSQNETKIYSKNVQQTLSGLLNIIDYFLLLGLLLLKFS